MTHGLDVHVPGLGMTARRWLAREEAYEAGRIVREAQLDMLAAEDGARWPGGWTLGVDGRP